MRRKVIPAIVGIIVLIVAIFLIRGCQARRAAEQAAQQQAAEQAAAAQQAADEQLQRAVACVEAALPTTQYSSVTVKSGGFSWADGLNNTSYEHFSFTADSTDKQGEQKTASYDMLTASSKNYYDPPQVSYLSANSLAVTNISDDVATMSQNGYSTDAFADYLAGEGATDTVKRNASIRAHSCAACIATDLLDYSALDSKLSEAYGG